MPGGDLPAMLLGERRPWNDAAGVVADDTVNVIGPRRTAQQDQSGRGGEHHASRGNVHGWLPPWRHVRSAASGSEGQASGCQAFSISALRAESAAGVSISTRAARSAATSTTASPFAPILLRAPTAPSRPESGGKQH